MDNQNDNNEDDNNIINNKQVIQGISFYKYEQSFKGTSCQLVLEMAKNPNKKSRLIEVYRSIQNNQSIDQRNLLMDQQNDQIGQYFQIDNFTQLLFKYFQVGSSNVQIVQEQQSLINSQINSLILDGQQQSQLLDDNDCYSSLNQQVQAINNNNNNNKTIIQSDTYSIITYNNQDKRQTIGIQKEQVLKYIIELLNIEFISKVDWVKLAYKVNDLLVQMGQMYLQVTGLDIFKQYLLAYNIRPKIKGWTSQDDEQLRSLVQIYGGKHWGQISNHFDGRFFGDVSQRWLKYLNQSIKKGRWNYRDDVKLFILVENTFDNENNPKEWSKINQFFENRTDIQIRERWCNLLDPNLKILTWNKEEDDLLLKYTEDFDGKWSRVASKLMHKSDNQCLRRWKVLTSKKQNLKSMEKLDDNIIQNVISNKIPIFQPIKIGRLRNFIMKDLQKTQYKYQINTFQGKFQNNKEEIQGKQQQQKEIIKKQLNKQKKQKNQQKNQDEEEEEKMIDSDIELDSKSNQTETEIQSVKQLKTTKKIKKNQKSDSKNIKNNKINDSLQQLQKEDQITKSQPKKRGRKKKIVEEDQVIKIEEQQQKKQIKQEFTK